MDEISKLHHLLGHWAEHILSMQRLMRIGQRRLMPREEELAAALKNIR